MNTSRREFLRQTAAVSSVAAIASAGAQTIKSATPDKANRRPMAKYPNILYIIVEDTGPNYGCYGERLVQTPHIDELAAQGVRFTNAFCTAPVCSPSRSALMTGCYQTFLGAHHHRTWHWNKRPLPTPVRHICDWFRDAGYFTCNLQDGEKKKGLLTPREQITGARGNGKLDLNFLTSAPKPNDPFDGRDWNQRASGQPFFAHITIYETHKGAGWKVAREQPKSVLVEPDKLTLPLYYPDDPVARDEYANYLDAVHLADGFVGELLARLEREGLARDTIVVLSSDHGPLFRGKQFLYDNGLRIPLIVRFPDNRGAGTTDARLVSAVDVAPTMLAFAGVQPPPGATHGSDIFSPDTKPRTHVFAARDRMDTSIDRMRAVRTARFKYIRNYLPAVPYMQPNAYKENAYPTWNLVKRLHREGKLPPAADLFAAETKPIEELYEVTSDPDEVVNLAQHQAHAATLKELRGLVDEWVKHTDRGVAYEDPVDVFRGYAGHFPEDTPAAKKV